MAIDHATSTPRGNWVVFALIAVGLIAAMIAVTYWRGVGKRTDESLQKQSAVSDRDKAEKEVTLLQQAYTQYREPGKIDSFVNKARELAKRFPDYARAHILLGQLLLDQGDAPAAQAALEAGLALDARNPEVHVLAGHAALLSDDLAGAERHFSQAVGIDPTNGRYHFRLGDIFLRKGDLDAARRAFLTAISKNSALHAAHAGLSDLYAKQNKLGMALQQIQYAIDRVTADIESKRQDYITYTRKKAKILRRDNRAAEAMAALQTLKASERIEPDVLEELTLCWSLMGQPDMAAKLYEDAMIVWPMHPRIVAGAAKWQFQAGDRAAAERHLRALKKIDPKLPLVAEIEKLLEK